GAIVGPPLRNALQSALGGKSLTFTGVNYAADIAGFLEGADPAGSAPMAQFLGPRYLLRIGFIQAHQRREFLPECRRYLSRPAIVEVFEDVHNSEVMQSVSSANTEIICHVGDDICLHGDLIFDAASVRSSSITIKSRLFLTF
ncbi:hypothetical protein B0H13DRAFT_1612458, partial [Mycena leptocephala]